jgi:3-deoxy-D-manno-octulosonic-acid transferase
LILAPRHPERFAPVGKMVEAHGLECVARSTLGEAQSWRGGRVLLLDTLGELAHSYPLATVAFVGGSLMPAGGHNILEAAAAGKPVIVGPHMENFQEIADAFLEKRALIQVDSAESLADEIARLLQDDAARQEIGERALEVVAAGRGALERTVASLARLLA